MKFYAKRPRATVNQPWNIPALLTSYNWPINGGIHGDATIAILECGGGWRQSDVTAAFSMMGLEAPHITDVSVDGTANSPGQDADIEVALDIQVAAAGYTLSTGKAATIRIYWVKDDFAAAITRAANDGCAVFSMSWGAPEDQWGAPAVYAVNTAAVAAWRKGMACFAAVGDNDAYDNDGHLAVDCPACCPQVISCGGTTKPVNGLETVWNASMGSPNSQGTGGGYSKYYPKQTWQLGCPPAPTGLGRMVPDVAACADPATGYNIICNGQAEVVGGTSAVAPLWAGLVAATYGPKPGWILPAWYRNPQWFNNITTGDNGVYLAGPGPDPCTGLGSPNGAKFKT